MAELVGEIITHITSIDGDLGHRFTWGLGVGDPNDQHDLVQLIQSKIAIATADFEDHLEDTDNPHEVTKAQVGLGNVDNTSDADKPISDATQEALDAKPDDVYVNGVSVVHGGIAEIDLTVKQNTLVSGENIKTINNQSILGSGNITIDSGATVWSDIDEKPFDTLGDNLEVSEGVLSAIQPDISGLATKLELQAVEAEIPQNVVGEAPINNKEYARKNGQWVESHGGGASAWEDLENKPFDTIGNTLTVTNDVLDVDFTGYATEEWVEEQGYLTEHQSLSNYDTKSEVNDKISAHNQSTESHEDIRDEIDEVREIAGGLTTNYVCSAVTNPVLNTTDDVITLTGSLTDVNGNTITIAQLKVGDNVYVSQLEVFDRWYAGNSQLYRLETAKVPVNDVKFKNSSVVSNNVATIPQNLSSYDDDSTHRLVTDTEKTTWNSYQKNVLEGVQINGTDLAITNKKVNIPIAGSGLGVVKITSGQGLAVNSSAGNIYITAAPDSNIVAKTNTYQPITPSNLDKAVMEGLGNNSLTWSDAYKTNARTTIGAGVAIKKVVL